MKTHGDTGWDAFPSYLDIVVPRVLQILEEQKLKITFFIVGQDAILEKNHKALHSIADAGHEIGNHSFHHEPWLHLYSEEDIIKDLSAAEEAITSVTQQKPIGFRGPGFSLSKNVLKVLQQRGYKYDCSTFPTFLGPLARAYYFMTTKLTEEEKVQRKNLFGTFDEGFRPLKPYMWTVNGETLTEIPVTTMPIFKVPIHVSYILYAAKFSPILAILYLRIALLLCRLTGVQPSILLHPLDFLALDDAPELEFFPAMHMPLEKKLKVVNRIFALLKAQYDVVPMSKHAESLSANLPSIVPEFKALEQA
ncbi:polysaccharide deacetylase family protein [bacterium]|nr:polysaccharide deacetylase family protein [bacterium]